MTFFFFLQCYRSHSYLRTSYIHVYIFYPLKVFPSPRCRGGKLVVEPISYIIHYISTVKDIILSKLQKTVIVGSKVSGNIFLWL